MSSTDQNQTVSSAAAPDSVTTEPDVNASHASKSSGWAVFMFFMIGFVGSMLSGWILFPELLYSEKEQPIDFKAKLVSDPSVIGSDRVEWEYVDQNRRYGGKNQPDICSVDLYIPLKVPAN